MLHDYKSLEKLKKEHPEYRVDVNYYFYYHGDLDWKYVAMDYILGKDFKAFKKEYDKKKKEGKVKKDLNGNILTTWRER